MTDKQIFLEMIRAEIIEKEEIVNKYADEWDSIIAYWEKLNTETKKKKFTENGIKILNFMRENDREEGFKAKEIGEGLFTSSRTIAGAMRKLVEDGYVNKNEQSPASYSLTDLGKGASLDN